VKHCFELPYLRTGIRSRRCRAHCRIFTKGLLIAREACGEVDRWGEHVKTKSRCFSVKVSMPPRLLFEPRTYTRAHVTNRRVCPARCTQLIKAARRFRVHFSVGGARRTKITGKHSYPRFAGSHLSKLLILAAVSLDSPFLMPNISRLSVFTLKRWAVLVASAVGLHRSAITRFPAAVESTVE